MLYLFISLVKLKKKKTVGLYTPSSQTSCLSYDPNGKMKYIHQVTLSQMNHGTLIPSGRLSIQSETGTLLGRIGGIEDASNTLGIW